MPLCSAVHPLSISKLSYLRYGALYSWISIFNIQLYSRILIFVMISVLWINYGKILTYGCTGSSIWLTSSNLNPLLLLLFPTTHYNLTSWWSVEARLSHRLVTDQGDLAKEAGTPCVRTSRQPVTSLALSHDSIHSWKSMNHPHDWTAAVSSYTTPHS